MEAPRYSDYTTYAQRVGATPYTEQEWARMSNTQKVLIGVAMRRAQ